MSTQDDKERLLRILSAHGQQFLSTFNVPAEQKYETIDSYGSETEEWTGFGSPGNTDTPETVSDSERDGGVEQEDDGLVADSACAPNVTVFLESTWKQPETDASAKELRKSFMSSKVSNITSSSTRPTSKDKIPDGESDDERTNTQNDAFLHRLVHTKLLSGSLNPELDLNRAQRRMALAGRVLELAGEAKLGKGEGVFRQEQRNKAAKRVRDGLIRKKREQEQTTLEEAKDLGNYHPTLKRLYDSNSSSTRKKKRTRGLGMGIGNFVKGTLKLSQEEITSVTSSGKRLRGDACRGMRQRPRWKMHRQN